MSTNSLDEKEQTYILGPWDHQRRYRPKLVTRVDACCVYDDEGNRYLDFLSQMVSANLGLNNERVIEAIRDQAERICAILHTSRFTTGARSELGRLLAKITPDTLTKTFFSTSGTEAVEAAVKIARLYTGRNKIISRYRCYHGSTIGSMSLSGDPRRHCIEPGGLMPGVIRAPDPYCYRCPLNHTYPECGVACADYYKYLIDMEFKEKIAAVLVEPIIGSAGAVIVPPDEYLPRLREITEKADILLIIDEVMTGFGRTGKWFGMNHYKIVPDIMCMAKAIAGSYVPLGATVTTAAIGDYFVDNFFCVGHTFSGHPLAVAAGIATIQEIEARGLIENARRMGRVLEKRLNELKEEHRSIGDVRGKGLFWAVELVKNRSTKEPFVKREEAFNQEMNILKLVLSEALKRGVLIGGHHYTSAFMLAPPLIVTERDIDEAMNILDEVLTIPDKESDG